MPDEIPILKKIEMCCSFLDKLADAQGRAKCSYIYILNEYIESIHKDVLVMEDKIKEFEKKNPGTMSTD